MATALYRRYRPESFADVIGQEHVTEPLMQALRTGRVNHAYLFSGPRGCGKTTSARILARCLNCEQGPTPTPCGVCDSCVALARGGSGSVDVIEIDAASHGGVDDARDLRERASYGPAQSRYKIYIIDEAHMVTPQGFNALLKIVEEPPEHVKFVFATTEPEKVIGTIRSRTHHYPFRLVPPAKLTAYMERLLEAEGVSAAPGVLSFVVRAGGGSVRDSLSVLDQLIAGSGPEGLTYDGAVALLGFTDAELLDAVIDAFAAGDGAAVFRQVDKVIESGHDPRRFIEDLLERLRDLIIVAAIQDGAGQVLRGLSEDQLDRMRVQQAQFGPGALSRAADIVNAGLTELTGANSPRLQLELICARILLPGVSGEQGYAARLDRLERRLEVGGVPSAVAGSGASPASRAPQGATVTQGASSGAAAGPTVVSPPSSSQGARAGSTPTPQGSPVASMPTSQGPPAASTSAPHGSLGSPDVAPSATPGPADGPSGPHRSGAAYPTDARPATASPQGANDHASAPAAFVPSSGEPARTGGMDTDAIRRAWPDVLGRIFGMRRATWTFVSQHAQVLSYDGTTLTLGIGTVGLTNTFRQGNHAELVRQALIDELGVDAVVDGVPAPSEGARPTGTAPPPGAVPRTSDEPPRAGHPMVASGGAGPSADDQATTAGRAPAASTPGHRPSTGPTSEQGRSAEAGGSATPPSSGTSRATRVRGGGVPDAGALQHNSGWGSSPSGAAPDWAAAAPTAPPAWAAGPSVTSDVGETTARGAHRDSAAVGGSAGQATSTATLTVAEASTAPAGNAPRPAEDHGRPRAARARGGAPDVADQAWPAPAATRGASAVRESFAQARAGSVAAGEAAPPVATDDSAVSADDEDIEHSSDVGRAVIERVLGGRVLEEREE